jgi:hypothetical protein
MNFQILVGRVFSKSDLIIGFLFRFKTDIFVTI